MSTLDHPMALIILDGWGWSEQKAHNPLQGTPTPVLDALFDHYPHRLLDASGQAVGLPEGQIGNSEVGHLHLGAGRLIPQDLTRINQAIASGEFAQNPVILRAIQRAKKQGGAIHILGLLSPGGVHSQEEHIFSLLQLLANQGLKQNYVHAFLDGRDVTPKSAETSLVKLENLMHRLDCGAVASVIGRYYAMDRDQRWDRVQQAYDLLTEGKAEYRASSAVEALHMAYRRGESDEFVHATLIGEQAHCIKDGDSVIFMNFRADRARQLSHALVDTHFNAFKRDKTVHLSAFITLTHYEDTLPADIIFSPTPIHNTFGEYVSHLGLTQLRIAETEKYAHVTYFFNGGVETPYSGEDRSLIPSPKVATYDAQPEMSAPQLTARLIEAIRSKRYDAIICNYANFDMIGHTGDSVAASQAIVTIDHCLGQIIEALKEANMDALITADHGNIECMYDEATHQAHTAHTTNLVPLLYVGKRAAEFNSEAGSLADIAPTLLYLMGLNQPKEMTGRSLIKLK